MGTRPSLLDGKAIEKILTPDPVLYTINGVELEIYPMEDEKLQKVTSELERIVGIIYTSTALEEANFSSIHTIIISLPKIIAVALPEATALIAVALDWSQDIVKRIPIAHKLGLLGAIIEAEDVTLLIKNGTGLGSMFAGLPQPENVTKLGEEIAEAKIAEAMSAASTGEPTTNS